jgi:MFS transporter, FSR family, fosmidomycin resistance protein
VPVLWVVNAKTNQLNACSTKAGAPDLNRPDGANKPSGIGNRQSFSALLTVGAIDNATRTALLTFLPFLLMQKSLPRDQVPFALTLLFAGGAAGKFLCGVMAEWCGIISMVVSTEVITALGILSLIWTPIPAIWAILPILGIALNGTSSVLYATVAETISSSQRSRGYGIYYAITLGAGAVSPVVYGMVSDRAGVAATVGVIGIVVLLVVPLTRHLRSSVS